ncbi:MAG: VTT domain-containing protein [Deltaproteobacteria bacterium]|nr:VTT domain-containing protein [Deltaproteobacteria bacterium]
MDHILNVFGFKDLQHLVQWCGYVGLIVIVFAETGLLIGFFLPGDSLLVTAGLFAWQGTFDIFLLNAFLIPAAIIGDAAGYWFGKKTGPKLYERKDSRFFKQSHLQAAKSFYEKHGGKTIVIARFMPFVRTFAPIVAGIAQMTYRRFAMFNIWGGAAWVLSMTLTGFLLPRAIPGSEKHVEKVIIIVVLLSIAPGIYAATKKWLSNRKQRREAAATARGSAPSVAKD